MQILVIKIGFGLLSPGKNTPSLTIMVKAACFSFDCCDIGIVLLLLAAESTPTVFMVSLATLQVLA